MMSLRDTMLTITRQLSLALMVLLASVGGMAFAQDEEDEEFRIDPDTPILEREPFDIIVLDSANGDAELQVVPLDFPDRMVPDDVAGSDTLRFRLIDNLLKLYEVPWRNIVDIKLYEEMIRDEAARLIDARESDDAFRHLDKLLVDYPDTEGLDRLYLRFLYVDGLIRLDDGNVESSLAVFEELYDKDKNYRPDDDQPTVNEQIDEILDLILGRYVRDRNYRFARMIMRRVEAKYNDDQADVVQRWRDAIRDDAEAHRDQTLQYVEQGEGRKAHEELRKMLNVLPTIEGGQQLAAEIMEEFPLVLVAVEQPARRYNPRAIEDWASRRVGRMSYRSMVEFQGQGQDGGQYRFPHGRIEYGDDGKSFTFQLTEFGPQAGLPATDAYQVSRRILDRALPTSFDYQQGWRRLLQSVEIQSADRVHVVLNQPHVLPESLLQIDFSSRLDSNQVLPPNGLYAAKASRDPGALFEPNPAYAELIEGKHPQIVELTYAKAEDAVNALLRGDIDVIDRIFPGDIRRLDDEFGIEVQQYQVPTVHMLVPNLRTEHMKNPMFRLALLMGINREAILANNILGGLEQDGFEVISGPFPIGATDSDPVNYGYDFGIEPKPFDYQLAGTIVVLAEKASERMLERLEQKLPPRPTLVLAHPATELATVACTEIASTWKLLGIECELRPLPAGRIWPEDDNYDLVYTQISMSEPLVEARQLLAEDGIVGTDNGSVDLSLRALDVASSWPAARRQLYELHSFVHNEVLVLPLFQTVEHFAYRTNVRGVGRKLISLYDNVYDWRITTEAQDEVARSE